MSVIGRMQVVVRCERVPSLSVHAGTAEPLRVSPPEAVAYLLELIGMLPGVAQRFARD